MKIFNNLNVQKVMKSYNNTVQKTAKTDGIKIKEDKIEISEAAREVQVAMKALKDLPEVREDLVNRLKQAIQDGSYKPSSEEIAKRILGK